METNLSYSEEDLDHTPVKNKIEDNVDDLNCENNPGVNTINMNELVEKNKLLEESLKDALKKNEDLQKEIKELKSVVAKDKQRIHVYKRKVQFLQENRALVNTLEGNSIDQTNVPKVVRNCYTQTSYQPDEVFSMDDSSYVAVKVKEFDDIKDTFQNLRTLVELREQSRNRIIEREAVAKQEVITLKQEVRFLKALLRFGELTELPTNDVPKKKLHKNTDVLNKVIVKLSRALHNLQNKYNIPESVMELTEFEKKIVHLLVVKEDEAKLKRFNRSHSCDRIYIENEFDGDNDNANRKTRSDKTFSQSNSISRRCRSLKTCKLNRSMYEYNEI